MSAATAATARPALHFLSADTATGIVAYSAPSAHDAHRLNTVSLDTTNGDTHCDCKASECGRSCWHLAAIRAAWDAEAARLEVVWLTDAQLVRYGTKARRMVETYAARIGRSRVEDRIALLVARGEYRRRARLGLLTGPDAPTPAPVALPAYVARRARREAAQRAYVSQVIATALGQAQDATERAALAAIVGEWEALSHSDRHLDRHVDGSRGEREYLTARATLAALASGPFDIAPLLVA